MRSNISFLNNGVILDACCVINLYATDRFPDILSNIPQSVYIAEYVVDKEAKYTTDDYGVKRPIDITPYSPSYIEVVYPDNDEYNTYLEFSKKLIKSNGESYTGAIALHRDFSICTDDIKAIKYFTNRIPQIGIITTPEIIKNWIDSANPSAQEIRNVILKIEREKYHPPNDHPLQGWWHGLK